MMLFKPTNKIKDNFSNLMSVLLLSAILIPIIIMAWGLSMLSDSMNKSIDDQTELNFLERGHQQGYSDEDLISPHCFYHEGNGFFGDCKVYFDKWKLTHEIPKIDLESFK